jgi:hypothetical protein
MEEGGLRGCGRRKDEVTPSFPVPNRKDILVAQGGGEGKLLPPDGAADFKQLYGNPDGDPRGPYKAGKYIKERWEKSNPFGKNYYA